MLQPGVELVTMVLKLQLGGGYGVLSHLTVEGPKAHSGGTMETLGPDLGKLKAPYVRRSSDFPTGLWCRMMCALVLYKTANCLVQWKSIQVLWEEQRRREGSRERRTEQNSTCMCH